MLALLWALKEENVISALNYQFARLIHDKQATLGYSVLEQNLAVLLAALVSYHIGQGNTALRLNSAAAVNLFDLKSKRTSRDFLAEILQKIEQKRPLEWQDVLKNHVAFSDEPQKIAPMLFQNGLLYFYRYWQAENRLATYFSRAAAHNEQGDLAQDNAILAQLFPPLTAEIDWQKIAVATALRKPFCLISGGPGTGKTTTVVKLLAALQIKALQQQQPFLNIALVAPTGKAASRLEESIEKNLAHLDLHFLNEKEADVRTQIPNTAKTIHRLLGLRPLSDQARFHPKNPLPYDVLVVDEASMIDLSLMEKLIQALRPTARLIVLGDKDQLASVEAGAMMGELGEFITQGYSQAHCDYLKAVTGEELTSQGSVLPICDTLCHLRKSHRFDENSGIGNLSAAVNAQVSKSWALIEKYADLNGVCYPEITEFRDKAAWAEQCANLVANEAVAQYRDYLTLVKKRAQDPASVSVEAIFQAFQRVRFLSALRVSELGVERLNQRIAEKLRQAGLVQFVQSRDRYLGKPILVTENSDRLSSGDVGIILVNENGEPRIYFDKKEKSSQAYLNLPLSQMGEYEVAYAMTVHKSQGSEFEHTLLVMPLEMSPVVTKELIYTAITRAKKKFTLFSSEKAWNEGVKSKIQRQSGLNEQLTQILS